MNINSIDSDSREMIFSYLDFPTLARSGQVCKLWYQEMTEHPNWTYLVSDTLASTIPTQPNQTHKSKKLEIGRLAHSKTKTQIQDIEELKLRIGEFIKNLQGNNEGTFFGLSQNIPQYWIKINVQLENKDDRYNKIIDACIFNISNINTLTYRTVDKTITDLVITKKIIKKKNSLICIELNIPYCDTTTFLSDQMIKRITHINLPFAEYHLRKITSFPKDQALTYANAITNLRRRLNWNDLGRSVRSIVSLVAVPSLVVSLTTYAITGSPTLLESRVANQRSVIATAVLLATAAFNYYRQEF